MRILKPKKVSAVVIIVLIVLFGLSIGKTHAISVEAMNYYKKGRDHFLRYNCDDLSKAKELYKKASEIDPSYAAAWAELAWVYHHIVWQGCSRDQVNERLHRTDCLTKAMEIDSNIPTAYALLAAISRENGQYEMAIKQIESAIDKNPNSALLHYELGELLIFGGKYKKACAQIKRAIQLDPVYPWYYLSTLSLSYFMLEQYDNGL